MLVLKKIYLVWLLLFCVGGFSQEICNNGIDDDADGLIDLNDIVDCSCVTGTPTLVPSFIPNPSFENFSTCPNTLSQITLATGWESFNSTTPDYFNSCGFTPPSFAIPVPDGNGIVGELFCQDWREYIATCLSSPLIAGHQYQLQFHVTSAMVGQNAHPCSITPIPPSSPVNLTLYGNASCSGFGNLSINTCPTVIDPNWVILGSINYIPSTSWNIVTISFTALSNINAITLGAPCNLPAAYPVEQTSPGSCNPYIYYDNLILNDEALFHNVGITSSGHYCTNDLMLNAVISTTTSPGAMLQWYHNGIALIGATTPSLTLSSTIANTGDYHLVLTDAGQCAISPVFNVTSLSPPISIFSPTICATDITTLVANSFCSSYLWNTGATTPSITTSPASGTSYTVVGSLGTCTTQAVGVVETIDVNLSVSGNTFICLGQSTTLSVTGANFYSWDDNFTSSLDNYSSANVVATPTSSTVYSIIGNSSTPPFCFGAATVTVNVIPSPSINATAMPTAICSGNSTVLTAVATGINTYTWSTGAHTNSIVVSPPNTTTYSVVTGAGTCTASTTVSVSVMTPPNLVLTPNGTIELSFDETIQLTANSTANNYTWFPTSGLSCINCSSPIASPTEKTTYCVQSANGACTNSICVTIDISACSKKEILNLANAFSPNGDGNNDVFCVQGDVSCIVRFNLSVFDRWGENVFQTTNPLSCWDGIYRGKNASQDVFIYHMEALLVNDKKIVKKGNVTLIR